MYASIELIINKLIESSPLNPSIKFAPLIINKKHNNTKIDEKILLFNNELKKGISIFRISIGIKYIKINKKIIIKISLFDGLILVLKSSKKPTRNIKLQTYIYSNKIFE
jgi:hypothetical protein